MIKKKKWIDNFSYLDPDDQLEVADAIVKELNENEMFFDDEEYDKEKSKVMKELWNKIKSALTKQEELKNMMDSIQRFESLSLKNQRKVLKEIIKIISEYIEIQEQENKESICSKEGHIFEDWKKIKWTERKDTVIDHQFVPNYPIEHLYWERTCERCGEIEKESKEPQELIDKRKRKKKTIVYLPKENN